MEKRNVALIGACNPEWMDELLSYSENGEKTMAIPWEGPVIARHPEEEMLNEQLKETGYFKLYFYFSRRLSNIGRIQYVAMVNDAKFFPQEQATPFKDVTPRRYRSSKQWFKISSIKRLSRSLDLQTFECTDNSQIDSATLQRGFAYVFDIPSVQIAFDTFHIVDFSKEIHLEQLLADNPDVFEKGELKLIGRHKKVPCGELDLLFSRGKREIIVVEVKNEKLSDSGLIQIEDYLNWAKKKYVNRDVSGIIVCQSASRRQKNVILRRNKKETKIEIRTYECGLRLVHN